MIYHIYPGTFRSYIWSADGLNAALDKWKQAKILVQIKDKNMYNLKDHYYVW